MHLRLPLWPLWPQHLFRVNTWHIFYSVFVECKLIAHQLFSHASVSAQLFPIMHKIHDHHHYPCLTPTFICMHLSSCLHSAVYLPTIRQTDRHYSDRVTISWADRGCPSSSSKRTVWCSSCAQTNRHRGRERVERSSLNNLQVAEEEALCSLPPITRITCAVSIVEMVVVCRLQITLHRQMNLGLTNRNNCTRCIFCPIIRNDIKLS